MNTNSRNLEEIVWGHLHSGGSTAPIFWFDRSGLFDAIVDTIKLPVHPERLSIEWAFRLRLESVESSNPLADRVFYVRDDAATEPLREILRCFGDERSITFDNLMRAIPSSPSVAVRQFAEEFASVLISRWSSIPADAFKTGAIDAGIAAAAAGSTSLDPVEIAVAFAKGRRAVNVLLGRDQATLIDAAVGRFLSGAFGFADPVDGPALRFSIARTALIGELLRVAGTRGLVSHLLDSRLWDAAKRLANRISELTGLTYKLGPEFDKVAKELSLDLDELEESTLLELRLMPGARQRAIEQVRQDLITVNPESAESLLSEREWLLDEDPILRTYKQAHQCFKDIVAASAALVVRLGSAEEYMDRYANEWFRIDQSYRRAMAGVEGGIKNGLQYAYRCWLRDSNVAFTTALNERASWTFENAQRTVGRGFASANDGLAIVVMDALRYELGCDLADRIGKAFEVEVSAGVASLPSITEVGMSALVPSDDGMRFEVKGNKLRVFIGSRETTIKSARDAIWEAAGFRVYDALDAALVVPSDKKVVVFHGAVDAIGEKLQSDFFAPVEQLIVSLVQLFQDLAGKGFEVIGVADHGFLTLPPLDGSGHINPGIADDEVKKRRYRVSAAEPLEPPVITRGADALGVAGDVSVGFPPASSVLSAHGALMFLHGGISLQEMVIPHLRVRTAGKKDVMWDIVFPDMLRARNVRVHVTKRSANSADAIIRLGVWRDGVELAGREVPILASGKQITVSVLTPEGVTSGPLLLKLTLAGGVLIEEKLVMFDPERE